MLDGRLLIPVRLFTIVPSMQSVSKLGQHDIIRSHVTFVRTFDGCISVGKIVIQDLNEFIVSTTMIYQPIMFLDHVTLPRLFTLQAKFQGLLPTIWTVQGEQLRYRQNGSNLIYHVHIMLQKGFCVNQQDQAQINVSSNQGWQVLDKVVKTTPFGQV